MVNENDAILPPSQMPFLAKRKSAMELKKLDDAFYASFDENKASGVFLSGRGRKPKQVDNLVLDKMKEVYENSPLSIVALDDILTGVANMRVSTTALSKRSLVDILSHLEVITKNTIKDLTGYSEKSAQEYMKACEIAIPFLQRANFKIRVNGE